MISAVYIAGLLQGLALVAFPAASSVLTGASGFALSSTSYGALFIPQAILSILCSLLTTRFGSDKTHYYLGMIANFASMALFASAKSFPQLLLATSCLGIGFGLTVPALNTLSALYFPNQKERALLILNTLLGLGTALAPLLTALFIGLQMWRGLPLLLAIAILLLLLLPIPHLQSTKATRQGGIHPLFWFLALLYGIVETVNGNWATLFMKAQGADLKTASLALTLFWSLVTAGRLFFSTIDTYFPEKRVFHLLPFITAAAFLLNAFYPAMGLFNFALAGFGCSALLPLIISFGLPALSSGSLIAFYLLGYGIAAFGVGPLHDSAGLSLQAIFGWCTLISLILGILSFKENL